MSWKNLKGFYVYIYKDIQNVPYYVGMGSKNRVTQKHLYVNVPPFERIETFDGLTQQQAWDKEVEIIAFYGREDLGVGPLKNLTNGGPTQRSGWNHSATAKQKISAGNCGKIRSPEQRNNYKKPKSKDHIEKIRLANIGRKDDGRNAKIGKTMSLKKWYNNGNITKMFIPGTEESGFFLGRKLGRI